MSWRVGVREGCHLNLFGGHMINSVCARAPQAAAVIARVTDGAGAIRRTSVRPVSNPERQRAGR